MSITKRKLSSINYRPILNDNTFEIRAKAQKQFLKIVGRLLNGEGPFPLIIPANKKIDGTNFNQLSQALVPLLKQSKQSLGKGYTIDWVIKNIDGSQQKIPSKIYIESLDDFLHCTKQQADYNNIISSYQLLVAAFPVLQPWLVNNTSFLLANAHHIVDVIKVINYFYTYNPPHHLYLRELPIEVHSKFIEHNSAALIKLLDIILPSKKINPSATSFSARYFVKTIEVFTQIRVLDVALQSAIGFDKIALSLDDAASLTWQPSKVFIIENKACYLSFPQMPDAVAIFGEGFKSRLHMHIPWLAQAQIFCWFDLDAAGFEMLNMIRHYYPKAESFLMDFTTLKCFEKFQISNNTKPKHLTNLKSNELKVYSYMVANSIRLEQERITNKYLNEMACKIK